MVPSEEVTATVKVANVGKGRGYFRAQLFVRGKILGAETLHLFPGQEKTVTFSFSLWEEGSHLVSVGTEAKLIEVTVPEIYQIEAKPVMEEDGLSFLLITVTGESDVSTILQVIDPTGIIEKFPEEPFDGRREFKVHMPRRSPYMYAGPLEGSYEVKILTKAGSTIFDKSFAFSGPAFLGAVDPSIWDSDYPQLSLELTNVGDLPTYVYYMQIEVSGQIITQFHKGM